eukprot:4011019-Pyramimonas_sp.AAC.1
MGPSAVPPRCRGARAGRAKMQAVRMGVFLLRPLVELALESRNARGARRSARVRGGHGARAKTRARAAERKPR